MKILYIAYSCSPNNGTEDKLGWYIPSGMASDNEVWIITKPDDKEDIDQYIRENSLNINVLYCDIPNIYKSLFNGAFYPARQGVWIKKIIPTVKWVCLENKIDIIHQVNPVEFRSIGNFGVFGIPFVCGPIGGGEYMPKDVISYAKGNLDKEAIRAFANSFYKAKFKVTGRIKNCRKLLFANVETRDYLIPEKYRNHYDVITELGIVLENYDSNIKLNDRAIFISAGRLIYRKGFSLLLDAVRLIPQEYDFIVYIIGVGPLFEKLQKIVKNDTCLSSRVKLLGYVQHTKMKDYYSCANYLVMPSLRETTGSVVLEALERGIPVITVKKFGALNLLNDSNSIMYEYIDGLSPAEVLADAMIKGIKKKDEFSREKIIESSMEFSFDRKCALYEKMYKSILDGDALEGSHE